MYTKRQISHTHQILRGLILLAVILSTLGLGSLPSVGASEAAVLKADYILSDGQFVYGPNVDGFNLHTYLESHAPHLSKYAVDLYERSEYFSINPKVYLTLLELQGHVISNAVPSGMDDPFGLPDMDFISQIDYVSNAMVDAYYLHLNFYTSLPLSQRNLPPFTTRSSELVNVESDTNAGTYAVIAALAKMKDGNNIAPILDNDSLDGFYQTYLALFENDDPLDEKNHVQADGKMLALVAPDNFLQLPFLQGLSWRFGGVHDNNGGGGVGSPLNDASAMDFYPGGISWEADTSNMWVAASASGTPTKISNCYFKILHADGWETTYYHLENIQTFSGSINQNDKIGVIANTLAEATCSGGAASGPHVHFTLKHNGVLTAINGTPLSGWYVHAGRWNYDTDPNYMWIERAGIKKYPFNSIVLSEGTQPSPLVMSITRASATPTGATDINFNVTFSQNVTGVDAGDFSLTTSGVLGAAVSGVSGSGSIYTVTVNTGSGSGTIRLDITDNDSITNGSSNPIGGIGLGNGNFITGETYTVTKSWVFGDVPNTYWAHSYIERLYNAGITGGCSIIPLLYCPENTVTRAQMAVFLLRGMHGSDYSPPSIGVDTGFMDVPSDHPTAAWIKQLAAEGITGGCGVGLYCPDAVVTRAQMAVFLLRAKYTSSYTPPPADGDFTDVPLDYSVAAWIEQLALEGITGGCGAGIYCPDRNVTRDQMAIFLVRTFNLP